MKQFVQVNSAAFTTERWYQVGRPALLMGALLLVVLATVPFWSSGLVVDKLTTLFVYILLAVMWNLLAGYAGLVSVGQQAFFGLGAYFALRLVEMGMSPYPAFFVGALGCAVIALFISVFALRFKDGEFAIAMWVTAEVIRILVMFDPIVQGETGTSLLVMNQYEPEFRRNSNFWFGLVAMAGMLGLVLWLINSRIGAAAQAIRDDEEAANSVGIRVMRVKQIIFVVAAFGCALAGAIWLASSVTFQPRTYFGVQWTVFMLFMVLVGGLRTFEGPIIGAIAFFLLQEFLGDYGVWYLSGLGVVAILFALYVPNGIWGELQQRRGLHLLPTGVRLKLMKKD
ncbi:MULTISPECIES: branched-chain amino acid ABC transporter permease [Marinomonas]|uniref:Branched-chain amino acid ABC transporter permease n=1 Tax=Marinomonas arctica TaxID=383750 RepID=A0A7H1J1X1_9GAMM|nr:MULTISPECIES: branched-chain amino acid ABC transporter permease [Marinomonas]QNT04487.1 branched-chain amino acid ABC transporter permease [Marinomonas arctica]GGN32201.1 branched-chain amino acid ABC transporter permease [Marinomonas arctica]